jgi:hypothetical protein
MKMKTMVTVEIEDREIGASLQRLVITEIIQSNPTFRSVGTTYVPELRFLNDHSFLRVVDQQVQWYGCDCPEVYHYITEPTGRWIQLLTAALILMHYDPREGGSIC